MKNVINSKKRVISASAENVIIFIYSFLIFLILSLKIFKITIKLNSNFYAFYVKNHKNIIYNNINDFF